MVCRPYRHSTPVTNSQQVGGDVDFPFAFMRGATVTPGASSNETEPKADVSLADQIFQTDNNDLDTVTIRTADPETESIRARAPSMQQPRLSASSSPQAHRQQSGKKRELEEVLSDKKRSISMTSFEELKPSKSGQEKFPFFQRLGRSLSRRMPSI